MQNRIVLTETPDDGIRLQSIMLFPTNQDLRDCWYTVTTLTNKLATMDNQAKIELTKESLDKIIDAPSFSELKDLTVIAVKKGTIAGYILAVLYVMDRFNIPEPSIKKAVHIVSRFAQQSKYGDLSSIVGSRRAIREAFKKYKTVVPLWAAIQLDRAYIFADDSEFFCKKLPLFLEVSAGLREFGITFVPLRARPKDPVLSSEETWWLPENTQVRHLKSDVFPDQIIKFLEDYDANEYQY